MRIGEITVDNYGFEKILFWGNKSFLDFDVIILDFEKVVFELYGDKFNIHDVKYKPIDIVNDPKYRDSDFQNYIVNGRKLIVITPFDYSIIFQRKIYRLSDIFVFLHDYTIENRRGKEVNIIDSILGKISTENGITFSYDGYFGSPIEKPLVTLKNTNYAIAAMPNEQTLFLPRLNVKGIGNYTSFFNDVIQHYFVSENKNNYLPNWAFDFTNKDEAKLIEEYTELKTEKEKIEEIIEVKIVDIEKQYELKRLFTSTGVELENIVEYVFTNMGFEVLLSEENRHDLILKYNDKIVVSEIKGVTGSASEKNSTQLEKWVSIYHADYDVQPKGILVINAFKDLPINKRIKHVFPDQMIPYAKSKNHCLISGLQLYGFYLAYLESNEKEKMIYELLSTTGVYSKYNDYKEFLSFKEKE